MRFGSLAVAILCFFCSFGSAHADYAEGYQAFLRGDYPRAEEIWRKSAWVDDDVESQKRLGKLYATGKFAPYDPIEAYVWYFLAVINSSHTSKVAGIWKTQLNEIFDGIKHLDELAIQMTTAERHDAEKRIIYVLSSRGTQGFVKLGELYAEDVLFDTDCTPPTPGAAPSTDSSHLGTLLQQIHDSDDGANPSGITTVADPSIYLFCGPSPYANTSVIQKNSVDAYAYFLMARDRGYSLAKKMADEYKVKLLAGKVAFRRVWVTDDATPKQTAKKFTDLIIKKAQQMALDWEPPFEVYPGGHSDESPWNFARAKALARVKHGIKCASIQSALGFLGFYRGAHDCVIGPKTHAAIGRYQASIGHATTGVLTSEDTVLLIKTAATKGQAASQEQLGEMYFGGIGEPLNYARAKRWFERAADQRQPYALYNLGIMYRDGLGTDVDFDQAAVYFIAAGQSPCPPKLAAQVAKQLAALGVDTKGGRKRARR